MKKTFFLTVATLMIGLYANAQMAYFTKASYPLDGTQSVSDSIFVEQGDVVSIQENSGGGSTLIYFRANKRSSADINEQVGDSASTFATFVTVLSSNDTLDSITINGVNISGTVNKAGSTGATAGAIKDSINATTSSPNYTATVSTNTITIISAVSTSAANGLPVIVNYQGTATPTAGVLSGGFTRRNAGYIYGAATQLFEVSATRNTADMLINKSRVSTLAGDAPTTIWYHGAVNDNIEVTENRSALTTTINALP